MNNKSLKIATLNVRTLKGLEKLTELESALVNSNIDVLGIAEVRRDGEAISMTKNKNLLCYKGIEGGQKGVGFIIKGSLAKNLLEFIGISERIALLRLKMGKNQITLIQVYAPTSTSDEKENKKFYKDLKDTYDKAKHNLNNPILIMGDFNSQIGERKAGEEGILGPYNFGTRNKRGANMVHFCLENNLKITNTFFKKRKGKRWTWLAPNQTFRSQIDFILAPSHEFDHIKDCSTKSNFQFHSDHRPLICTLNLQHKRYYNNNQLNGNRINKDDYNTYMTQLDMNLRDELGRGGVIDWEQLQKIMLETSKTSFSNTKTNSKTTLPPEITNLIRKREVLKKQAKTSRNKIEFNLLCKTIKIKLRMYNQEKNKVLIHKIMESSKSIKAINKERSQSKSYMTALRNKEGTLTHDREGINEVATEFYRELYSSPEAPISLVMLDSQEREPYFLYEEVSRVVKKLKENKATGPDGISNEHVKYGGKTLIKILTELFNEILETKQIPKSWKLSKIILLFKKGSKYDIRNYRPISLISTFAKIFSALIDFRLRGRINLSLSQAGFKKGFSTTDHLHTINLLLQRATEYQQNIHIAFIDFTKAFDLLNQNYMIQSL